MQEKNNKVAEAQKKAICDLVQKMKKPNKIQRIYNLVTYLYLN